MGDGDTRFRALLPIGNTLYVFGYINPSDDDLPMEGRHLIVRNNKISDLDGEMEKVVVWKTWPLNPKLGLAVGNVGQGVSRTFQINHKDSFELTNWSNKRVLYVTPGEIKGYWLVLTGSGSNNETFSVYSFNEGSINKLVPVLELGEQSYSSIALWHEDLFLGSSGGQVYKSIKVKK